MSRLARTKTMRHTSQIPNQIALQHPHYHEEQHQSLQERPPQLLLRRQVYDQVSTLFVESRDRLQ